VDGRCDIADAEALRDGETQLATHFSRAAGHDRRTNQHAPSISDQLNEPVFVVIARGPIHTRDVPPCDGNRAAESFAGRRLAQADLCHLGIRERDPGHGVRATGGTARQQRVPRRLEGLPTRDVRELLAAQDIARRVDVRHVSTESVVDRDAAIRMRDARAIEGERRDIRTTSGGNQKSISARFSRVARRDDHSGRLPCHSDGAATSPANAFTLEHALKDIRRLGVIMRQQARRHDRDAAAQALKGLRQLHAEWAATNHDKRCRQLRRLEDVVIREMSYFRQSRNRRC
jgi:hypothetical protein